MTSVLGEGNGLCPDHRGISDARCFVELEPATFVTNHDGVWRIGDACTGADPLCRIFMWVR